MPLLNENSNSHETNLEISVAARSSELSQTQVKEVLEGLHLHYPQVTFTTTSLETTGDIDQTTSLRNLGKTDFFTAQVDRFQLEGKCRVSIHSAKDLPEPLANGLTIAAITKGLDPSDSLVLRQSQKTTDLSTVSLIATSSIRREEAAKSLVPHAKFTDLRGDIKKRLSLLDKGSVDGVIVAEAALIRLGLTDLNRVKLPGETTALQGQLAIVVRNDDNEMIEMFSCLDERKKDSLLRSRPE
jgi:hydroxymethylbilane synthase